MNNRKLLFSVTKDDLDIQTFRAGGKGGQLQNKVESGVRIIHRESGAIGEARDGREQWQNKKKAFQRMIATPKFQGWYKLKTAALLAGTTIEKMIDTDMSPKNLLIEGKDEKGQWERLND